MVGRFDSRRLSFGRVSRWVTGAVGSDRRVVREVFGGGSRRVDGAGREFRGGRRRVLTSILSF